MEDYGHRVNVYWSIRYEKDKVMITSVLDGVELYFNPCSGRVEDVVGKRHLVSMPDINILTVAEDSGTIGVCVYWYCCTN